MSLGQEILLIPWTKLATDIFHFKGVSYLLIVDYTSRFLVVHKITQWQHSMWQATSSWSSQSMDGQDTLVSDNGPCYSAKVFTNLMQEYSVNHITSSPHYPQSKSLAEKFVQIMKNLFHKAKEEGTDLFKSLMIYHNAPLSSNLQSPITCYKIELSDHSCQCLMQLGNSLDSVQINLESRIKIQTYHCMTCV